jgi:hypothetical protein
MVLPQAAIAGLLFGLALTVQLPRSLPRSFTTFHSPKTGPQHNGKPWLIFS